MSGTAEMRYIVWNFLTGVLYIAFFSRYFSTMLRQACGLNSEHFRKEELSTLWLKSTLASFVLLVISKPINIIFTKELWDQIYLNLQSDILLQLKRENKIITVIKSLFPPLPILTIQGFTFLVDCKVGEWKPWGECSATCGGGTKTRARDVIGAPENGGASCPDTLEETDVCNTDQCVVGSLFLLILSWAHVDIVFLLN